MIKVNSYFPSEMVSNAEKEKLDYGKKFSEAMYAEWEGTLQSRALDFEKFRKYADGKQDIEVCKANIRRKYINEAFLHIDWSDRLNLLQTLLRNAKNSVNMDEFVPNVYAIDPTAREERSNRKNEKMKLFYAKDFIQQVAQTTGQAPIPLENIPQSKEQVEIEEATEAPLSLETAEELVLHAVAKENNFKDTQGIVLDDAMVCGLGVSKITTCPVEGIKIELVENSSFIHSKTKHKFFANCNYFGEIKELSLAEVMHIAKNNGVIITEEEQKKMTGFYSDNLTGKEKVKVLLYTFKTFKLEVLKKKKNRKTGKLSLIDRTNHVGTEKEYNPKADSDISEKIQNNYEAWMEGILILSGDRKVIKHGWVENLPEYKGYILPQYIAFAPRISENGYNSIIEEVIPRVDAVQELRYRILHLRNTLRGTITEIDPDSIANISLGNKKLTPEEVLSFYFSLNISFRKTKDEDGEFIQGGRPLNEIPTGIPYALRELTTQFIEDVRLLDQSFGYIGADKSKLDEKTLVDGEPYRLSDNVALKDYSDGLHTWSVMVYQVITSRLNDVFKWSRIKNKYINLIGTDDVNIIEKYSDKRSEHYFSTYLDYIPNRAERISYLQNINQYVLQGLIDPLDGEELKNIRKPKLGLRVLRLRTESRKKEQQEFEMKKISESENVNVTAARVSNEEKRITLQMEYELDAVKRKEEFERKLLITRLNGEISIQTESVRSDNRTALEDFRKNSEFQIAEYKKEHDRDTRLEAIQKSKELESQLIDQRKGKSDGIYQSSPTQQVDLSQLNTNYNYGTTT